MRRRQAGILPNRGHCYITRRLCLIHESGWFWLLCCNTSDQMDPEDVPAFLDKIHTAEKSSVDILRLVPSETAVTNTALDDKAIVNELADINRSVVKPLVGKPASSSWGPFVLV